MRQLCSTLRWVDIPGLAIVVLLQLPSQLAMAGIAGIVVLTMTTYAGTQRYAGKRLEQRREIVFQRLS